MGVAGKSKVIPKSRHVNHGALKTTLKSFFKKWGNFLTPISDPNLLTLLTKYMN